MMKSKGQVLDDESVVRGDWCINQGIPHVIPLPSTTCN
jgi:hypothetical protein